MVTHAKVTKAVEDFHSAKRHAYTEPQRQHFNKPLMPIRRFDLPTQMGADTCGIEQPVLHTYLDIALKSDNPAIQHKLKELIAITKLITPADDPAVEVLNRDMNLYYRHEREWRENTEAEEIRYTNAHKEWSLRNQKMRQDLGFYCDDLISGAFKRVKQGEFSVWDQLAYELIVNSLQDELYPDPDDDVLAKYHAEQLSIKVGFLEDIRTNHSCWIIEQVEELTEDYLHENGFHDKIVVMEADLFLGYFDQHGDPLDDTAEDEFCVAMSDYDSEMRCIAREMALEELRRRHKIGMDDYDCIYNYFEESSRQAA